MTIAIGRLQFIIVKKILYCARIISPACRHFAFLPRLSYRCFNFRTYTNKISNVALDSLVIGVKKHRNICHGSELMLSTRPLRSRPLLPMELDLSLFAFCTGLLTTHVASRPCQLYFVSVSYCCCSGLELLFCASPLSPAVLAVSLSPAFLAVSFSSRFA